MERVLISEFKARCIELIKRVQATRQPLIVTLRGQPVAKVVPFEEERRNRRQARFTDR